MLIFLTTVPLLNSIRAVFLPLLGLQNMFRVRSMKDKPFEIEVAHTAHFGSGLEVHIGIITDAVVSEKSIVLSWGS